MPRDEAQGFSLKPGARRLDDLRARTPDHLSGFQFAQPVLGLIEPKRLSIGVCLLINAEDQALREPSRSLRESFKALRWFSHTERL